jgi:hypothetical protein
MHRLHVIQSGKSGESYSLSVILSGKSGHSRTRAKDLGGSRKHSTVEPRNMRADMRPRIVPLILRYRRNERSTSAPETALTPNWVPATCA